MAKEIRAVLFDLGGTLIHFDGDWPTVMDEASQQLLDHLHSIGMELESEPFLKEFRRSLDDYYVQRESEFIEYTTARILRALLDDMGYPQVDAGTLAPALKKLYAVTQAHWKREDDAIPMLQALRAAGYRMGIVSNASDDTDVQTLVGNAGIRGYFDFVLTSAACGIRKPNPRIFEIALKPWGIAPANVAMVGDTLGADILGARNAGVYAIWITRRANKPGNRDHEDTIQADATIENLAELPPLLQSLRANG